MEATGAGQPAAVAAPERHVGGRLLGFDGLRGLAAVGVLLFHALWRTPALRPAAPVIGHLDIGVEIFFAMSGFLVARPLIKHALAGGKAVEPVDFWRKRVARIWPAYLVALVGGVIVGIATIEGAAGLLKHGLLIQTWFEDRSGKGLRVSWTLVVEIAFYIVILPLGALVGRAGKHIHDAWLGLTLGLFFIGVAAIVYVTHNDTASAFRILPPYLPAFAGGMLLAIVEFRGDRGGFFGRVTGAVHRLGSNARLCFGLAIGLFVAMTILMPASDHTPAMDTPTKRMIQGIVQALVAVLAMTPLAMRSTQARFLEMRWMAALGVASFGFYLWHVQVMKVLEPGLQSTNDAIAIGAVGLAIVGAWVMGETSRRVVEEPARKFLTR